MHYSLDLTVKERNERKALREEIKIRTEKGEKNLGIRNGKIVTVLTSFQKEAQPSLKQSWASLFK